MSKNLLITGASRAGIDAKARSMIALSPGSLNIGGNCVPPRICAISADTISFIIASRRSGGKIDWRTPSAR